MIPHQFDTGQNPFTNRHTRHNDDKLTEAVDLVQLENRAEVDIGLAGAGFHFYGEVPPLKFWRFRYVADFLDSMDIGKQALIVKGKAIPQTKFGLLQPHEHLTGNS